GRHAAAALRHATSPRQPLALLAAHRLGGELAAAAGDLAAAGAHLDAALALADACRAPYERALTLLARAALPTAGGGRGGGRPGRGPRAPAAAGGRPGPRPRRRPGRRGRRQRQRRRPRAARPCAAGRRADPAIAARLGISPRTVKAHTAAIYGKLGVTNRAAAIRFALDHGLA
ncbi:MAG TPA: LuxR C-terminal-related transcriptional regulator, partial [Thermomicrobiales bacterium]